MAMISSNYDYTHQTKPTWRSTVIAAVRAGHPLLPLPPIPDATEPSNLVTMDTGHHASLAINDTQSIVERESVKVLTECIDLQKRKANDYQNAKSSITQASYYPQGILTILDILHAKLLRMRSITEAMRDDPNYAPNFESIEDSAKDMINYASFLVAYSRGKIEGQDPNHDFLNRKKANFR